MTPLPSAETTTAAAISVTISGTKPMVEKLSMRTKFSASGSMMVSFPTQRIPTASAAPEQADDQALERRRASG